MEFNSIKELYDRLKPALKTKCTELKRMNYYYIKEEDIGKLQKEVLLEPKIALNGGKDGLDYYRKICSHWTSKIKHGGIIAFEIGFEQSDSVKKILEKSGFENIKLFNDINNIPRVIIGEKI